MPAAQAAYERLDTQPTAAKVKAQVMDGFDKTLWHAPASRSRDSATSLRALIETFAFLGIARMSLGAKAPDQNKT
jgi:hypothetical protein